MPGRAASAGISGLRSLSRLGVAAEGTEALAGAGDLTRVGRWMSPQELNIMSNSGRVVEGAGGRTYVINPPNPAAYTSAAPGSVYAEFNVPTSSLFPASKPEWSVIPGPNVTTRLYGPPPASMPPATCIVCVIGEQ
ncbi:TreTu family toxin [Methylosinus sporium]|uniref:TreTu family toxin n=1 Tax=Methylosinus sporium TaxID=428 RepID=UPI003F685BFB